MQLRRNRIRVNKGLYVFGERGVFNEASLIKDYLFDDCHGSYYACLFGVGNIKLWGICLLIKFDFKFVQRGYNQINIS